jgi:hypothetical protein
MVLIDTERQKEETPGDILRHCGKIRESEDGFSTNLYETEMPLQDAFSSIYVQYSPSPCVSDYTCIKHNCSPSDIANALLTNCNVLPILHNTKAL